MRNLLALALLCTLPALAQTGENTALNRAVQAPAGTLSLTDHGVTRSLDCAGRSVTVAGNGNTVTLTGACAFVNVTGNGNVVVLETARVLQFLGNGNRVTWAGRPRYVFNNARTTGNTAGPASR